MQLFYCWQQSPASGTHRVILHLRGSVFFVPSVYNFNGEWVSTSSLSAVAHALSQHTEALTAHYLTARDVTLTHLWRTAHTKMHASGSHFLLKTLGGDQRERDLRCVHLNKLSNFGAMFCKWLRAGTREKLVRAIAVHVHKTTSIFKLIKQQLFLGYAPIYMSFPMRVYIVC